VTINQADADKTFYTVTMARLLTKQQKYAEAVRIYIYLLEKEPWRADLQTALKSATARLARASDQWRDVSRLVERWTRLMIRRNAMARLKQRLSAGSGRRR
jgi:hypothetical protein